MTTDDKLDGKLSDEQGRLSALHRFEVLDTPAEEPFDRITKLVQMVLNVPIAAVTLIDSDRQWFKSCVGLNSSGTSRDESFCTHTIQRREPMKVTDATADPRFVENPLVTGADHIRSYLGVPLKTPDGYNIGALCAIDRKPRDFTVAETDLLTNFASLVMDELELRRIAQTDHLTGAVTRRAFVQELEKQIARMERSARPSGLILLDVDHFKKVNDTYGHPVGDMVLKNLSETIHAALRKGDVLARLGGEEFGILLPDASIAEAFESAERIRQAVASKPLVTEPELHVTISLGIASHDSATLAGEWIASADKALYEAKRSGRNKVCVD